MFISLVLLYVLHSASSYWILIQRIKITPSLLCQSKKRLKILIYFNGLVSKNGNKNDEAHNGKKRKLPVLKYKIHLQNQIHSYNNQIMLSNPAGNLQNLVTNLLIDQRYKQALRQGVQIYHIRQFRIQDLTPQEVFAMHYALSNKFYFKATEGGEAWCENELRLFVWVLVGYSFLHQRCVSDMTLEDWQFFSEIFNKRSPDVFQFQALSILKKEVKFAKWTSEEVKLLDSIIKSMNIKNKWNDIAKNLFVLSGKKYFRTSKQCRQYWINHLDPTPIKAYWSLQEDLELVKAIKYIGKKWSKVSKKLQGRRTQHMVKNRYKSLCQLERKRCMNQDHRALSEEELPYEIEKRLRSLIETEKTKLNSQKQEVQTNVANQNLKFQSADVQKITMRHDLIQQLLIQSEERDNFYENAMPKLIPQYQTIFSLEEESHKSETEDKNCQQMQEVDDNFSDYFSPEIYFNL